MNIYLHCDPTAKSIADLGGYNDLLADHKSYGMSIPVIWTEYGCENGRYPTIDGFEGQRNWLQVDALYSSEYQDWFAGGVVFEYSVEKTQVDKDNNGTATFPYQSHARENFGLGYFRPSNCDDNGTDCLYTPYPEFDTLATKYSNADGSGIPDFDSYTTDNLDVTSCPSNFPPLTSFTWESDSTADLPCVGENWVFICPNTAPECLPDFARPPTVPPTMSPTIAATKPEGWVPTEQILPEGESGSTAIHGGWIWRISYFLLLMVLCRE